MRQLFLIVLLSAISPSLALANEGGQQIRFAAGADYGTVSGTVLGSEVADYRLGAAKGQRMTIAITSVEDNAVFHLYGPKGILVSEARSWTGVLPANYPYRLRVSTVRGNATYRMIVHIR